MDPTAHPAWARLERALPQVVGPQAVAHEQMAAATHAFLVGKSETHMPDTSSVWGQWGTCACKALLTGAAWHLRGSLLVAAS